MYEPHMFVLFRRHFDSRTQGSHRASASATVIAFLTDSLLEQTLTWLVLDLCADLG